MNYRENHRMLFESEEEAYDYLRDTDDVILTYVESMITKSFNKKPQVTVSDEDIQETLLRREFARSIVYDEFGYDY